MSQNILTLQDVYFDYRSGLSVLSDINLEIAKNDLVVIRGESGAGKSTFLKIFNRFCDITHGRLLFHDRDLYEYKIDSVRSSIIYFPQVPLMIDGTIEKNLSFPFSFKSNKHKHYNPDKAREWLDYFQMDVRPDHDARELSVGQKQRVALIRSMLLEPEVLLLDEPGSALDNNNKRLIEQKIESLMEASGVTVLMATHSEVSFTHAGVRFFGLKEGRLLDK